MAIALIAGIASAGSAIIAAGGFAAISGWAIAGAFALGAGLSLVSRALQSKPDIVVNPSPQGKPRKAERLFMVALVLAATLPT